jgi:two-component system C4-dicarboxylate transport response regulator DctD
MSCTAPNTAITGRLISSSVQQAESGEGILFVEDEPLVREVTAQVLEAAGYVVWTARNAAEAVRRFHQHGACIQLLITDVRLPDRSGPVLARQLQTMGGLFPTILISGYPERVILKDDEGVVQFDYLAKPFSAETLKRKVRQVLAQQYSLNQR